MITMVKTRNQKRFKPYESNSLKNSNIQESNIENTDKEKLKNPITSTDRIETIKNYPDHNKKITENITLSTPNEDQNSETIESNSNIDSSPLPIESFKTISDITKLFRGQKLPARVLLKLFGEEDTILEQMQNYIKCKFVECLWDELETYINNLIKTRMWEKKFESLLSDLKKIEDEYSCLKKNSKTVSNNQITHLPGPSTSKIQKVTTISTVSPPITIDNSIIDLTSDDEDN